MHSTNYIETFIEVAKDRLLDKEEISALKNVEKNDKNLLPGGVI